jgi:hypothetical protein
MNRSFLVIFFGAMLLAALNQTLALAASVTVQIQPATDGTITRTASGPFNQLEASSDSIELSRPGSTSTLTKYGALEFSIQAIPIDAVITDAKLRIWVNVIQGPAVQMADFHGYFGNGIIELQDASVPDNLVAQFVGNGTGNKQFDVDTSFLTAARDAGNFVGLLAKFTTTNTSYSQLKFNSQDLDQIFSRYPYLQITYVVPEPSTFILAGIAGVALFAVARRRAA